MPLNQSGQRPITPSDVINGAVGREVLHVSSCHCSAVTLNRQDKEPAAALELDVGRHSLSQPPQSCPGSARRGGETELHGRGSPSRPIRHRQENKRLKDGHRSLRLRPAAT
ncbi:hypothetical protein INR49_005560 [Caranx melampygus]|nr:hypothetical protein INR49_005560 [Caranx melampygus]